MKSSILLALTLTTNLLLAQSDSSTFINDIKKFQKETNDEYKDPKESPLEPKALRKFKGLDFFPINLMYRVSAKLVPGEGREVFNMPTTSGVSQKYVRYGRAFFTIQDKEYSLMVYQSVRLSLTEKYKNYLFLPFTDLTNGKQSYEGGRFIGLEIPKGDSLVIDFNKAYNPNCAYSDRYSCPITPTENHLEVEVLAGVRMKDHKARHPK